MRSGRFPELSDIGFWVCGSFTLPYFAYRNPIIGDCLSNIVFVVVPRCVRSDYKIPVWCNIFDCETCEPVVVEPGYTGFPPGTLRNKLRIFV